LAARRRRRAEAARLTRTQAWAWRVGIPVAGSGRSGLLLAVRAYQAAVGVLSVYEIMLAHNVPAYIATRKWRVLKVTPTQVVTEGRSLRSMTVLFSLGFDTVTKRSSSCESADLIIILTNHYS